MQARLVRVRSQARVDGFRVRDILVADGIKPSLGPMAFGIHLGSLVPGSWMQDPFQGSFSTI